MSKYTIELRQLFESSFYNPQLYTRNEIENWFKDYELTDYLTEEQITSINNYGVWSKDKLATKIIDHYYMREIGFETPALFKHYAKITMQELMEKYLPLIYSASIKYDPLENVNFTETLTRTIENTSNGESNSNSNSSGLNVNSDTPQGEISKQNILQGNYATSTGASENEISDNTTTSSTGNTEESYSKNIKGNNGATITNQKLISQFRDNVIAIDKDIIKDLNILFMGLY